MPAKDGRARIFATVLYEESAAPDWRDQLSLLPCFVSPLHDSDVNPDGEQKKPHRHVMFAFDGKKSIDQVREIIDQIGGVGLEVVASLRAYARYLCHLDNPEKHQYLPSDVLAFGGLDYDEAIASVADKYKTIGEMIDWCDENGVYSYATLLRWARSNNASWFKSLCDSSSFVLKEYLKSKQWEADRMKSEGAGFVYDAHTGELL